MNNLSDLAAEKAVLSGVLNFGNDSYIDISDIISINSFTLETNQIIWKVIQTILENNNEAIIDPASFLSSAFSLGYASLFEKPEEKAYLKSVYNFSVQPQSIRKLAAKIRKLEISRIAKQQLNEIGKALDNITGEETISHILGLVENPIFNFTNLLYKNNENEPENIFENIEEYVKYLKENPIQQLGISTGFPNWDASIGGGLRRATVNVIGARPKIGKSSMAINVAIHVLSQNIPVLYLDTEMTKRDTKNRFLADISKVPIKEIETGTFGSNQSKDCEIDKAAHLMKNFPFQYLNISGQAFEETLSLMRRWIYKKVGLENGKAKQCVIIYDYLKLLSYDSMRSLNIQEFQLLGFMMTALHNFAVHYDIPILTFAQLNRDGINREETDVIAGSDRIGWLCSSLSILKPQSDDEIADQHGNKIIYNRKLVPLACRHGPGLEDGDHINIKFTGNICEIIEGPTRFVSELQKQLGVQNQSFLINNQIPNVSL